MLSILLLILKIIGIIILVVLGLLLLIVLTVLLVPIRYRVAVEHGDDIVRVQGRVHWLLHVLHASITHLEGVLHIRVRVFGFVLYDNLKPRKPKVKKKIQKAPEQKKAAPKRKKAASKPKYQEPKVMPKIINEDKHKADTVTIVEPNKFPLKSEVRERKDELPENLRKSAIYEAMDEEKKTSSKADISQVKVFQKTGEENSEQTDKKNNFSGEEEKLSLVQKIILKLKNAKGQVFGFFSGLKSKLIKMFDSFTNIKRKFGLISDFIKDEMNREGFSITYSGLKKLLKHILPQKLSSRIVFGTGDPCSTGQILGVLGILYSFYGDKVQITPDFENSRLEGKHYARGRIRLVTILIIVIKLILNKRFKQLKNNFQILKEAL